MNLRSSSVCWRQLATIVQENNTFYLLKETLLPKVSLFTSHEESAMSLNDENISRKVLTKKDCYFNDKYDRDTLRMLEQAVAHRKLDAHRRDKCGLTILLHAAVAGRGGEPIPLAFYHLLEQNEQPLTKEEKVEGLELLGSTYILVGLYEKGLECWGKACDLRSGPRKKMPAGKVPTIVLNSVRPEWTVYSDVAQNETDHLNLIHQALLVRHRILSSVLWPMYFTRMMDRYEDIRFRELIKVAFHRQHVLLLLEWDAFYRSSSRPYEYLYSLRKASGVMSYFIGKDDDHSDSPVVLMTWLKWLTAHAMANPNDTVISDLIALLLRLCNEKVHLDGRQTTQLKKCIQLLVGESRLRISSKSRMSRKFGFRVHLLLELCRNLKYCYFPAQLLEANKCTAYSNDTYLLSVERLARILIENDNQAVNYTAGNKNTCLHFLLEKRNPKYFGLIQLLLDNGARWDKANVYRKRATDYAVFKENTSPMIVLPKDSLASLCARSLRQNYVRLREDIDAKLTDRYLKRLVMNRQEVANELMSSRKRKLETECHSPPE